MKEYSIKLMDPDYTPYSPEIRLDLYQADRYWYYSAALKEIKKAQKVCCKCGKRPPEEGRKTCQPCLDKLKVNARINRAKQGGINAYQSL